ncbi:hypothetical protein [Streptomyces sp. AC627_RSS907]|uniref:hypothetical protein n=1 Tax=Streptomyces sp. AC627_RSS907 TaxID=2823684 RepID=UPI001C211749|nr:hypothetical protein [Streptomyces sp. AC627_RSS907]
MLSTSCDQIPEHPSDENLVLGFRVTDADVQVKVPVCPGEELDRVEVWDPGSETREEKLLWWGEGPTGEAAANGLIKLWSPTGYRKAATSDKPAEVPSPVDVSVTYAHQEDSVGDLVDFEEAAKDPSAEDRYWTIQGKTMTAREIDEQLSCATKSG